MSIPVLVGALALGSLATACSDGDRVRDTRPPEAPQTTVADSSQDGSPGSSSETGEPGSNADGGNNPETPGEGTP
jgi:hypothetical protein